MAKDLKLSAESRSAFGSTACRRLRRDNQIPGNVYGHGKEPQPISVPTDAILAVIHSGHRVVDLSLGNVTEKALIREVQWDAFGNEVLHFDLQRVSVGENIDTDVPVETHGLAPGVVNGGSLEISLHTLRVTCPAIEVPDKIEINVNSLEIGDIVHVRDLNLPEGLVVHNDEAEIVVQVVEPMVVPEVEEGAEAEVADETGDDAAEGEQSSDE